MDMKLEVVVIPVSDVDRAKQLLQRRWAGGSTPTWRPTKLPGRADDPARFAGRDHLRHVGDRPGTGHRPGPAPDRRRHRGGARRAEAASAPRPSEVFHDEGGVFHHGGTDARVPGPDPEGQQLRLVPVVPRPGRQRLGPAGDHDPAAGPARPVGHHLQLELGPGRRAAPGRRRARSSTRPGSAPRTRTGRPGTPRTWCAEQAGHRAAASEPAVPRRGRRWTCPISRWTGRSRS